MQFCEIAEICPFVNHSLFNKLFLKKSKYSKNYYLRNVATEAQDGHLPYFWSY